MPIDAAPHHATSPICIHSVTVAYDRRPVLWDVDVDIVEGNITGIIGPNGAGKTTLLKAILGLVPLVTGDIKIFGASIEENRKLLCYVPQRESVDWDFPVSALDVVLMGRYAHLGWFKRPTQKDKSLALSALEQVGLSAYASRQISQLSGGQQQRVFLARALAQDAKIYLMDEPFAGVDAATEKSIVELLRTMRASGVTIIVIHHDLQTVRRYFDQVLMLNMRLVAAGPTEAVFTDKNLAQTYGGRLTLLDEAAQALSKNS